MRHTKPHIYRRGRWQVRMATIHVGEYSVAAKNLAALAFAGWLNGEKRVRVMGFGVNVNTSPEDFPIELRRSATSVCIEYGQKLSRVALLQAILNRLEECYLHLRRNETTLIIERANRLSSTTGQEVRIETANGFFEGTAERIDLDGGCTNTH